MKTPGLHLWGLGSWPSLSQLLCPPWLIIIITPPTHTHTSLGPEYVYFLWTSGYLSLPEPCLLSFPLWLSVPWIPCPPGSHFWFPRAVFFRLLQLLSFGQPSVEHGAHPNMLPQPVEGKFLDGTPAFKSPMQKMWVRGGP